MAGNKKISQLVDGGAGQAGDNFVIERGGVNFKVDNASISGNPGGLDLLGIVNDMIVKDEKSEVALEQRIALTAALSFVDNTAVPPSEVDGDIFLLDDTGASNAAWDGNPANTRVKFDGLASLWRGIPPVDGMLITLQDTGFVRYFDPTSSTWELLGVATPAGIDTEIQFNNAGVFGASSLFTFSTAFTRFSCDANAIFNEGGNDRDFRIEGLSESNLFFVDADVDRVGIGTNTPSRIFTIVTDGSPMRVTDTSNNAYFDVLFNSQVGIGSISTSASALLQVHVDNAQIDHGFTGADGLEVFGGGTASGKAIFTRDSGGNTRFQVLDSGNLGLIIGTATAVSPIDMVQLYSADWNGAVTATLHARNEEGHIFIYKQSAAYTRNAVVVEDRTLLASASATTLNNNNVLAALIGDLQGNGLLG